MVLRRVFTAWRYPLPSPEKQAFRSSGGLCEPLHLLASARSSPNKACHRIEKNTPFYWGVFSMARPGGFEPSTYRFVAGHSIHWAKGAFGASDGNRTHATSLEGWNSTIELHSHLINSLYILPQMIWFVNTFYESFFYFFINGENLSTKE